MWSLIISIDFNNLNFGYTVCFMCCLNGRRFASGQSIENCQYEMFHNLMLSWKLVSKTSKNPFLVYGLVNCCARLSKYLCNILLFGLSYHLQRGSFMFLTDGCPCSVSSFNSWGTSHESFIVSTPKENKARYCDFLLIDIKILVTVSIHFPSSPLGEFSF